MGNQELAENPVGQIKLYVSDESVKKRFEEMLGKRSGAFLNSIINVYEAELSVACYVFG